MSSIPGVVAKHRWVTDQCRESKGDAGAMREAVESLYEEALQCLDGHRQMAGVRYHFALTVERDGGQPEEEKEASAAYVPYYCPCEICQKRRAVR